MQSTPGNSVKTPGSVIHFEVAGAGSGVPLFILNGGPGFDHSYLKLSTVWALLGSKRPVILYDQRGTGQSLPVEEGDSCSLADQLADLLALQGHLHYDQIDLLGHSWGGFLAMAYTARYAANVRRLVLVNSAAPHLEDTVFLFKHAYPDTVERQKAEEFGMELGDDASIQTYIRHYFSMLFYSPQMRDAFAAKADPRTYRHKVNERLWKDAQRFDLTPELSKFTQPTLVITGRFDMNVAPSVAYAVHKAIQGSELGVFERSGHLPFFEEPEEFGLMVDTFLSKG